MSNDRTVDSKPDELPLARKRVGWAFRVATAILCAALIDVWVSRGDFVVELAVFFFLCLSFLHQWFAFQSTLTQKQTKQIDYLYIGAAAVGMFMFAISYAGQREAILLKEYQERLKSEEELTRSWALDRMRRYERDACERTTIEELKVGCAQVRELIPRIKPDVTREEAMDIEIHTMVIWHGDHDRLKAYYTRQSEAGNKHPYEGILFLDEVSREMSIDVGRWALRINKLLEAAPKHQSLFGERFEATFVYLQAFAWPFLLGFALALRLAKVTIDVYGWAK